MILITGAGGKTGRTLVKGLANVEGVCGLVHREEHVSVLKSLGADKVIVGDLRDRAAIRSAMWLFRASMPEQSREPSSKNSLRRRQNPWSDNGSGSRAPITATISITGHRRMPMANFP